MNFVFFLIQPIFNSNQFKLSGLTDPFNGSVFMDMANSVQTSLETGGRVQKVLGVSDKELMEMKDVSQLS